MTIERVPVDDRMGQQPCRERPASPRRLLQADTADELMGDQDIVCPQHEAVETAEDVNKVFMVGPHPCIITAGGTRMACRNLQRYVGETWAP
eukprot:4020307-Amphidinium_carterae.1